MNTKKTFGQALCGVLCFTSIFLAACAGAAPAPRDPAAVYTLVVLDTNDHHGAILARDGKAGLAERATFVNSIRAQYQNVLLLDAGDINTGSALSNMFDAEPDIKAYNMIGYAAAALGNHEFDNKLPVFETQQKQAKFTWLAANIKRSNGAYLAKPYIIKNYEGFRVAIIGLTTKMSQILESPDKSLVFLDETETAKEMIKKVREEEKADIVILLTHMGDVKEDDRQTTSIELAQAVSGVDLIIDGHSHSYFAEKKVVNGIPVVTTNSKGFYVGEGLFTIQDGKALSFTWKPVEITSKDFPPDPKVAALIAPYSAKADASLKTVVMKTSAPFLADNKISRYQETTLGDFTADAMVDFIRSNGKAADFAFVNGGALRATLPQGDVTMESIINSMPFDNVLFAASLKGKDVIKLFEFIGSIRQGAGAWAQVSKEVRYTITYDKTGKGAISGLTINGQAVDPAKDYRLVAVDYLVVDGGDGYTVLKDNVFDTFNTSMILNSVVIEYAAKQAQPVTPKADGRITVIGGISPDAP
ncbi:MAG: 5'-nucleotidase C-terminal domain-containing protein [Spirochaetaceae bacterium]|jgi:5'-nucleotidase/UDP-sugar diphosphatase|nr:5'-nucleotidase C-terminal domain-containing protein [Spirochaetaceae bacterium]